MPIQTKQEPSECTSTVGKTIEWSELKFPCNLLLKYRDLADITENKPFQTIADAATDKFDFIRTFKEEWIKTEWVDLIQILPMPAKPTPKKEKK